MCNWTKLEVNDSGHYSWRFSKILRQYSAQNPRLALAGVSEDLFLLLLAGRCSLLGNVDQPVSGNPETMRFKEEFVEGKQTNIYRIRPICSSSSSADFRWSNCSYDIVNIDEYGVLNLKILYNTIYIYIIVILYVMM